MMLLCNIDAGTQIAAMALSQGSSGIGTFGKYFYSICPKTITQNVTPGTAGISAPGSLYMCGTSGSQIGSVQWTWTPDSRVASFIVYKGTADASGTYMYGFQEISGTLGTWIDPFMTTLGTGSALGSFDMAWSKSIYLPQPDSYVPNFTNNLITHDLFNFNTIIVDKKKKYTANLTWSQIGSSDKADLTQAFNWHANLRFYPNVPDNTGIYFNVYWQNDFNFKFISSNINSGYSGNVSLKGIEGLKNISEVV